MEKSLGLLTTKFVSLLQNSKDGVLDLNMVLFQQRIIRFCWIPINVAHNFPIGVHTFEIAHAIKVWQSFRMTDPINIHQNRRRLGA